MPTVSVRLPDDDAAALEAAVDLLDDEKSTVIRKALRRGLADLRTREAVAGYQAGELSAIEAARVADESVAGWLTVARERNLTDQLSPADLREDAAGGRRP